MKPPHAAGSHSVGSHTAVVLYDPRDGRVVHIHQFFVFEGGEEPEEETRARMAHDTARQAGHDVGALELLHADSATLASGTGYRVDTKARVLIASKEEVPLADAFRSRRR